MSLLMSQVINAVMLGCVYSLVGVGFSLFFGIMDVVVFCVGDIAVVGSYSVLALVTFLRINKALLQGGGVLILIVLAGAIITGIFMLVIYRTVIKPFEGKSQLMSLISTIAAGIAIEELIGLFYPQGRNPQPFPQMLPSGFIHGTALSTRNVIITFCTVLLIALLHWFVNNTKMGLSIQALSQNREAAIMVGINWRQGVLVTFFIGGIILGVGGFLLASYYNVVRFDMGAMYGLKGFSAAVVGGLGSVYGAIAGGMLIAFVEVFVSGYIPGGTAYASVAAFVMVIIFMLFKPEGIIGRKSLEKV